MVQVIEAQGQQFEFPDEATDQQIDSVLGEMFGVQAQPQPQQEQPGLLSRIGQGISDFGELVTGKERATERTEAVPELGTVFARIMEKQSLEPRRGFAPQELELFSQRVESEGIPVKTLQQLEQVISPEQIRRVSSGLATTLDIDEQIQIVKANIPSAQIDQDEKGNIFVNVQGFEFPLNKPGLSAREVTATGLQAAPFAISGGVGPGLGLAARVGARALASAGVQTGLEVGGVAAGKEQINVGNILLAGGLAFGAEFIGAGVGAAFKRLVGKKAPKNLIDESGNLTDDGRAALKEANISEEQLKNAVQELNDQLDVPQQLRVQRAKELGIDLPESKLRRSFELAQKEETLKSLPGGEGALAREQEKIGLEQLQTAKENFLETLGGSKDASKAEIGGLVKEAAREIKKENKEAVKDLYNAAKEIIGDSPLDTDKIFDTALTSIDELPVDDSVINSIEKALAKFGIIGKEPTKRGSFTTVVTEEGKRIQFKGDVDPISLVNAEAFRQRLNKVFSKDDTGAVASVIRSLDNAVEDSLEAASAGGVEKVRAFQAARKAASEFKTEFEAKDIIADLLDFKKGTRTTPKIEASEAISTILRGEKKLENLSKVKKVLTGPNANPKSKAAWNSLRTQTLSDVFQKATAQGRISGAILNKEVNKIGDDALKTLLNPKEFKSLKNLQGAIGDATVIIPRSINPSGSGQFIINSLSTLVRVPGIGGLAALLKQGSITKKAQLALKGLRDAQPEKVASSKNNRAVLNAFFQVFLGEESPEEAVKSVKTELKR